MSASTLGTNILEWSASIGLYIKNQLHLENEVSVIPLEDLSYGHFSTNFALRHPQPKEMAEKIAKLFENHPAITAQEVRGFVNFTLKPHVVRSGLQTMLRAGDKYGHPNLQTRVSVDHTDVNPTGLPHAGHARLAVTGDTICNFLEWCGCKVYREYILNDCGNQISALLKSVQARQAELQGHPFEIPKDGYHSEYLKEIAALTLKKQPEDLKQFVITTITNDIMVTLARIGVRFNHITSETELQASGKVAQAIESISQHTYHGKLPAPKSHVGHWNAEKILLLRNESMGDMALQKANGQWTYFASDIAFHKLRIDRGIALLVNVFGSDHHAHEPKLRHAITLLGNTPIQFAFCQMVSVIKNGKQYRMSKRAGNYLTIEDLISELGPEILRVAMLSRGLNSPLTIDVDLFTSMSKDNPYYYIQYAYTRTCSLLRHAESILINTNPAEVDLDALQEPEEINHAMILMRWPHQVQKCVSQLSNIHHLLSYARAISTSFHAWWCAGTTHQHKRFCIPDNLALAKARLALVYATQKLLETVMNILGVKLQDRMPKPHEEE